VFIDIFGEKEGKQIWDEYKTVCDYSPLRLYRKLDIENKNKLLDQLLQYKL